MEQSCGGQAQVEKHSVGRRLDWTKVRQSCGVSFLLLLLDMEEHIQIPQIVIPLLHFIFWNS